MSPSHSMTHQQAEARARRHFFVHLAVYLGVNTGLTAMNLINNPDKLWFYWPLMGWGIGVVAHAVAVFVTGRAADRVLIRQSRRAERQERRQ